MSARSGRSWPRRRHYRGRTSAAAAPPVPVRAHLCRSGAGKHLPGGADGVDGVALAVAPLARVLAGVDLLDMLPGRGQVPGQAQAVMPGALDGPGQPGLARLL